jgi:hypothetical protein
MNTYYYTYTCYTPTNTCIHRTTHVELQIARVTMSSSNSSSWTGESVLLIGKSKPRFPATFKSGSKDLFANPLFENDVGKDGEVDQIAETLSLAG